MWETITKIQPGENALIERGDDSLFVTANITNVEHEQPTKRIRLLK